MNFYEREMRLMFGDSSMFKEAKFSGRTMLAKLDGELRVKLQFVSTATSRQYDAVQATIINRTDGTVDRETFKFADIIGRQKRAGLDEVEPHMWEYAQKPEWYIPITAGQREQVADTVLSYVGMYQEEGMEMGGMQM